ncbi:FYN-binding protein 2 isoform X1 [Arvicola amphibius]|uniref:FYN-binding protein 2 isoform X1 n=1 Tax=Arvicola amphibius TaxID=1047088 RepID=UPI0018E2E3C5|nr:FYN-binding protein 2 isoform X1 [Arvicola amphibius]
MEEEGISNFKELRAKFQKFDAPPLPGPIKLPADVSGKEDRGHTQPTQNLAIRKRLSSPHHQPLPYASAEVSRPLKSQKTKSTQRGDIQKNSNSSGPLEKSAVCPARNSQKAAVPLDASKSRSETSSEGKGMGISSFRYKLWNWEQFSSQKSELSPAPPLTNSGNKAFHLEGQKTTALAHRKPENGPEAIRVQTLPPQSRMMVQRKSPVASEPSPSPLPQHGRKSTESPGAEGSPRSSLCQPVYECELTSPVQEKTESRLHRLPKTKPLPSIETLGPPPLKPAKPPFVNLQAFHRTTAVSKTLKEVTAKESPLLPDRTELEEPHNYDTTISYLSQSSNSINPCAAGETTDVTYEVEIEELQKPWRSFLHPESNPRPQDKENSMKEKEPSEFKPSKPEDSHPNHPSKVGACEGTPGKVQMAGVHEDRRNVPAGNQEAMTDIPRNRLFPEDVMPIRHSQDKGGYVEALEVTKETPSPSTIRSNSSSEKTYDDVGCSRGDLPKWDFSSSFTSDSEENSEEMYEDIYKTKNNEQKPDVDGRAALRRLQQLFRKEKGVFRVKKAKSRENVSNGFSMSLPDLGIRSQDVIIYDDVDTSEKEPKDEDKLKTWKPKFFTSKGNKREKGSNGSKSFSPRNFFRTKKHNLEKNRMEKEEKLFRERFQYGKEIVVINRAVACSSNSRNGIFDLPITPGEQLEVIDTTEQNLVICRNSKGKYGYVLIEHLHFKHQG